MAPTLPPAAGRRFEALAVTADLWTSPQVRQLLDALAAVAVSTAILGAGRAGSAAAAHARVPALAGLLERWWAEGIRPDEVAVLSRAEEPEAPPSSGKPDLAGLARLAVTPRAAATIMRDQLRRRRRLDLPSMPEESSWTVAVDGIDPAREPSRDVRLAMVDGAIGTLGSPLVGYGPARRGVYVAGVFTGSGAESDMLCLQDWTGIAGRLDERRQVRRILDMRTGLVHHDLATLLGPVRAVSFAAHARPGVGVLRAAGKGARSLPGEPLDPKSAVRLPRAAVAKQDTELGRGEARRLERVVAVRTHAHRTPTGAALALLSEATDMGFDRLVAEQRRAWARRWADADILIEGDPEMQRAVRFALFELMAHVPDRGEAGIGPRGATGDAYRGHVFWDSDVFILPFLAATHPPSARVMLEYRVRRLAAARAAAREAGFAGAWFPWESAHDGRDVTPKWVIGGDGLPLRVRNGERELHITSDVAWAAATYSDWTGDRAFAAGPGGELVAETARYWASRFQRGADGSAHLRGVIGPDEYHDPVDDDAFTNVMARWNLRRAAAWDDTERRAGGAGDAGSAEERASWLELADHIVDGFGSASGIYEQFEGFFSFEPVKIAELTTRPVWGDVFLGRERIARAQCVKQPDVLMLYHLVPDELVPATLAANLDFYDPRTAHGSSLSAGIHAALMARLGRTDEALATLRPIALLDLDDEAGRSADGLHVAAMGSVWQAIVFGFAGLRPRAATRRAAGRGAASDRGAAAELTLDPHLPAAWSAVEIPLRFQGRRVRIRIEHERLTLWAERPLTVRVPGVEPIAVDRGGAVLQRRGETWTSSR